MEVKKTGRHDMAPDRSGIPGLAPRVHRHPGIARTGGYFAIVVPGQAL